MPNVIDIGPLRALAKRASDRIGDETIAKRFERITVDRLLRDQRAFRPATEADLARAPDWARQAAARGEEVSVCRRNGALAARVHTVARRVADARRVANTDEAQRPESAAIILAAREFLAKFGRINFDAAARKSLAFSHALAQWREEDDLRKVCEPQALVLLGGFVWHRVTSVSELRKLGREFRNCLARSTTTSAYGGPLVAGRAQFWVLRDLSGAGLIVAMAPAPSATQFVEVKGPNNAPVRADNPQLMQLGIALGVRPLTPEPPSTPPSARALALDAQGPCRCSLCDPLFWQRLRRTRAAP